MTRAILVKGHLVGPRQVELEEAISAENAEVEVLVRADEPSLPEESWSGYLQSIPPGHRSSEEIDAQVASERDAWGEA